jgi:transcriptional regulator with XRE-family HTH domain
MEFNHNIFINNILYLVKTKCNNIASVFNKKIDQRDAITRWKKAEFKPSLDTLYKICNTFDVTFDWLLINTNHNKIPHVADDMASYNKQEKHQCPLCGDMTDEEKELCKKVKDILKSRNAGFASSLKTVIAAFEQCGYRGKEKRAPLQKLHKEIARKTVASE